MRSTQQEALAIAEQRAADEISRAAELAERFMLQLQKVAPEFPKVCPDGIPHPIYLGIRNYLVYRRPAGDFIMAVLRNNLHEALVWADYANMESLPVIVHFIYWFVPGNSWGSDERVKNWLDGKI
jgi:hypothetical protein